MKFSQSLKLEVVSRPGASEATGTSDALKSKIITKLGCLKSLSLFRMSLRMHEKSKNFPFLKKHLRSWRRGVVVITAVQLHSTKPELRFCAGSNTARGVSDIRYGENI